MSCRLLHFGGRPAFFPRGSNGFSRAHSASVKSARLVTATLGTRSPVFSCILFDQRLYRSPHPFPNPDNISQRARGGAPHICAPQLRATSKTRARADTLALARGVTGADMPQR